MQPPAECMLRLNLYLTLPCRWTPTRTKQRGGTAAVWSVLRGTHLAPDGPGSSARRPGVPHRHPSRRRHSGVGWRLPASNGRGVQPEWVGWEGKVVWMAGQGGWRDGWVAFCLKWLTDVWWLVLTQSTYIDWWMISKLNGSQSACRDELIDEC